MSSQELNDYFSYLSGTLGISSVLWTPSVAETEVEKPHGKILFIDETPWSPEVSGLFAKMREAMKLSPEQIEIVFTENLSVGELKLKSLTAVRVVAFTEKFFSDLEIENERKFLTVSPMQLIKNPALKKQAWLDLQRVMASLQD